MKMQSFMDAVVDKIYGAMVHVGVDSGGWVIRSPGAWVDLDPLLKNGPQSTGSGRGTSTNFHSRLVSSQRCRKIQAYFFFFAALDSSGKTALARHRVKT